MFWAEYDRHEEQRTTDRFKNQEKNLKKPELGKSRDSQIVRKPELETGESKVRD